jgi:thiamine biosynthesis protein ThiS
MTDLTLRVNGEPILVAQGSTIADLVAQLVPGTEAKGIGVAVDRCVIPRSEWHSTLARADSRVEVVTAAAGG